jgi:hypothetical protein
MVVHEIALEDFAILLSGQSMKDFSESGSDTAIQFLLPHLGDEDDMILTVLQVLLPIRTLPER